MDKELVAHIVELLSLSRWSCATAPTPTLPAVPLGC